MRDLRSGSLHRFPFQIRRSGVGHVGYTSGGQASAVQGELLQPQGQLRQGAFMGVIRVCFFRNAHGSSTMSYRTCRSLDGRSVRRSSLITLRRLTSSIRTTPCRSRHGSTTLTIPSAFTLSSRIQKRTSCSPCAFSRLTDLVSFLADVAQVPDVRAVLDPRLS